MRTLQLFLVLSSAVSFAQPLPADFNAEGGNARYSIPIAMPDGVAGARPKLALAYDARNGNGIAGFGWAVTGLSSISRCPQTLAQDGVNLAVQDTSADRFCLDGARLVLFAGTYGGAGSVYRTELESWNRVTAATTLLSGAPTSFRVETRSGWVFEYGTTLASRLVMPSGAVRTWALSRAQDAAGNWYTVSYDAAGGVLKPTTIQYTGPNPQVTVSFEYEARPDVQTRYDRTEATVVVNTRLKNIRTTMTGGYHLFELVYESTTSPSTKRSRLQSVRHSAAVTGQTAAYDGTLSFTYQAGGGGITATSAATSATTIPGGARVTGDFDGDGYSDVYVLGTPSSYFCSGKAVAASQPCVLNNGGSWARDYLPLVGDFDSDGRADLMLFGAGSAFFCTSTTLTSTGGGSCRGITNSAGWKTAYRPLAGDFDRDGKLDLLLTGNPNTFLCRGPGITSANNCQQVNAGAWKTFEPTQGDFDGDGTVDVLLVSAGKTAFCSGSALGAPCTTVTTGNWSTFQRASGDFNGDGISDLLLYSGSATHVCTGPGITHGNNCTQFGAGQVRAHVGDFNGDGKDDAVFMRSSDANFCSGDSLLAPAQNPCTLIASSNIQQALELVGDFNADGRADLLRISSIGATSLSAGGTLAPDLLATAQSNGAQLALTYDTPARLLGTRYSRDLVLPAGETAYVFAPTIPVLVDSVASWPSRTVKSTLGLESQTTTQPIRGTRYFYDSAVVDPAGRGFLGFNWTQLQEQFDTTIGQAGLLYRTYWNLKFPLAGTPKLQSRGYSTTPATRTDEATSRNLGLTEYTYACHRNPGATATTVSCDSPVVGGRYARYASSVVSTKNRDLVGGTRDGFLPATLGPALPGSEVLSTYDGWGNELTRQSRISTPNLSGVIQYAPFISAATRNYANVEGSWQLGRLLRDSTSTTGADGVARDTVVAFDYFTATGKLQKKVVAPHDANLCSVEVYAYDTYGLVSSVTKRGCNGSNGVYPGSSALTNGEAAAPTDPDRVFTGSATSTTTRTVGTSTTIVIDTNPLGHSTTTVIDNFVGKATLVQDANVLSARMVYDGLGRPKAVQKPDGTGMAYSYGVCLSCNTPWGIGKNTTVETPVSSVDLTPLANHGAPNGPAVTKVYDVEGRLIRTFKLGPDATKGLIFEDVEYDASGSVLSKVYPYYASQWTTAFPPRVKHFYDALGRRLATFTQTAVVSVAHAGLVTTVTDGRGYTRQETANDLGQVVSVVEGGGNGATPVTSTFAYDSHGNLVKATDALGNVTEATFDGLGRQTWEKDPNRGTTMFVFDVMGQLKKANSTGGNTVTFQYDLLGRLTSEARLNFNLTNRYDAVNGVPCGKGMLCESELVQSAGTVMRKTTYDTLMRPRVGTVTVAGTSYTATTTYDAASRPASLVSPAGFTLHYNRSANGYLVSMSDQAGGAGTVFWRLNTTDASLRPMSETQGNGVVTTTEYLKDRVSRLTAAGPGGTLADLTYLYDPNDNVTSRADAVTASSATFGYDNLDRLTTETRTGSLVTTPVVTTYGYDATGNLKSVTGVGTLNYPTPGAASVRPHAVASVTGTVNGWANPTYGYDARGRLATVSSSNGSRVSVFNSADLLDSVTRTVGGVANTVRYLYGPGGERVQELFSVNGVTQRTTKYLFGGIELETAGTTTTWRQHISAGAAPVATVEVVNGARTVKYLHTDTAGSILATSSSTGALLERLAYEPFGKRRYSTGLTDGSGSLTGVTTDRGYTAHEHMDEVGLINMNGRVYDPAIGRFLSPDPVGAMSFSSQRRNGYSYVLNNPLRFTDPSGFSEETVSDSTGDWSPSFMGPPTESQWRSWQSSGSGSGTMLNYDLTGVPARQAMPPGVSGSGLIFGPYRPGVPLGGEIDNSVLGKVVEFLGGSNFTPKFKGSLGGRNSLDAYLIGLQMGISLDMFNQFLAGGGRLNPNNPDFSTGFSLGVTLGGVLDGIGALLDHTNCPGCIEAGPRPRLTISIRDIIGLTRMELSGFLTTRGMVLTRDVQAVIDEALSARGLAVPTLTQTTIFTDRFGMAGSRPGFIGVETERAIAYNFMEMSLGMDFSVARLYVRAPSTFQNTYNAIRAQPMSTLTIAK